MTSIKQFWQLWLFQLSNVKRYRGMKEAYLSEYTLMNIVIGIVTSLIFLLLAVLAYIPKKVYAGTPTNHHLQFISAKVKVSDQMKRQLIGDSVVLNGINVTILVSNGNEFILEIPRYRPFTTIIKYLVTMGCEIIDVGNQTIVQLNILCSKK